MGWLQGIEEEDVSSGARLWSDCCATVVLLQRSTSFPDTSRFDRPSLAGLRRRVVEEMRVSRSTLKSFDQIRGLHPELDRLFEEAEPSADTREQALAFLAAME